MTYGEALEYAKRGERIHRLGWNGKGMFVFLIKHWAWAYDGKQPYVPPAHDCLPFLAMKTADGKIVPWLCSQTDALADDWGTVG